MRLIQKVPGGQGIWTCVLPSGRVTSVRITAGKSTISTTKPTTPGVWWETIGPLSAQQKNVALAESGALIAAGIANAELDAYKKPGKGLMARVQRTVQTPALVPAWEVGVGDFYKPKWAQAGPGPNRAGPNRVGRLAAGGEAWQRPKILSPL